MKQFFSGIFENIKTISVFDIIDITFVAILFYFLYKFMRDRRSGKLILGLVVLFLLEFFSRIFEMHVIQYILQNVFQAGLIAAAVIFQPELRTALEKVGGQPLKSLKSIGDSKNSPEEEMIETVASAVADLSASKTGALIVFERSTKLGDLILTGTVIDASPSPFLVKNIFFNKAPLHDGALIVRDTRLYAAGCLLPLSQNTDILKDLGTRHRAAIGMSENSDAVVVVVSEETGIVSIAVEGVLFRGYNKETLIEALKSSILYDGAVTQSKNILTKLMNKKNNKNSKNKKNKNDNKNTGKDEKDA